MIIIIMITNLFKEGNTQQQFNYGLVALDPKSTVIRIKMYSSFIKLVERSIKYKLQTK